MKPNDFQPLPMIFTKSLEIIRSETQISRYTPKLVKTSLVKKPDPQIGLKNYKHNIKPYTIT